MLLEDRGTEEPLGLNERIRARLSASMRARVNRARMSMRAPTARFRVLPDFLIIGGMRCGTSSLYKWLGAHPSVAPSLRKETRYLSTGYWKGEAWYRSQFPTRLRTRLHSVVRPAGLQVFEASPDYLFYPGVPERAVRLLPQAKLIVLLRDPVDRAVSHYIHNVAARHERLPFLQALLSEKERTARPPWGRSGHQYPLLRYSYVARGIYVDQLMAWERCYPRGRMLILRSEDLFARPTDIYREILEFLDLPPWQPRRFPNFSQAAPRTPHIGGLDEARVWLSERLGPHNLRLYEWLGRDMGW